MDIGQISDTEITRVERSEYQYKRVDIGLILDTDRHHAGHNDKQIIH